MDKSVELTDPATELAELVERLRPTKRMPTGLEVIAGVAVAQNDGISVDLLAIVKQRIAFVARSIPEFADPDGQLAGEASAARTPVATCSR
ncbi:hypothetical protein HAP47_0019530 [Bradyrhizobium sp. 41S5]|uniref:hypothetical protein n=1 Tax=Bradyrhizobium sp. 41S5 TaxID=1404443 RepID=UPI00156BC917|nr:hypothetical protein [Bradyrhizobium sp. 41S5]UFX48729.1 hypothetical protein HAP47_0019530 [Bradyrhizobium sp. 41S5]